MRNIGLGEFYHVYNRGIEKRDIFLNDHDRDRFLKLLYVSNGTKPFVMRDMVRLSVENIDKGEPLVAIGAYCLMPNHFHILLKEIIEGGITQFTRKLSLAYSMYFNIQNHRVGPLFQGRFAIRHADTDEYLKYLYTYIHLNPIKIIDPSWREKGIARIDEAKQFLKHYRYSSLQEYLGVTRSENAILSKEQFPEYFSTPKEIQEHINFWLTCDPSYFT